MSRKLLYICKIH